VFIDETWAKTNMTPLRGLCRRGERLEAKAPFGRWKTMTFIAALWCDRIDAPCLQPAGLRRLLVAAPDHAPELLTGHVNLIFSPVPALDFGVELEYGRKTFRRSLDLEKADALRLGVSSRVKFN
jgi:hypothetical protein